MKLRLTFLLCALSLALPALAATSNTGGPNWGGLSGTHKPKFHGECCYTARAVKGLGTGSQHGGSATQAGHHLTKGVCNLAGIWRWEESSPRWMTQNVRLKFEYRPKPTQIQYEVIPPIGHDPFELVDYDARAHSVQIFSYIKDYHSLAYATGRVSPNCRHMTLLWHLAPFDTRRAQENFVRR